MDIDLIEIRAGIVATILAGVDGTINGYPYPARGVALPAFNVETNPGEPYVAYHATLGPDGQSDIQVLIRVLVPPNAHELLDRFLGGATYDGLRYSIVNALEADRTLGGVCDESAALFAHTAGVIDLGEQTPALTAYIPLSIHKPKRSP